MEIGLIGLGKMGGNMAQRIRNGGHTVIGYDRSESAPRDVASLEELVGKLAAPRAVWIMVPAGGPTDATVTALGDLLSEGDIVVDGGNSKYTDDARHAEQLAPKGIGFVDAGATVGAGHFAKMVHNGIEYGIMQAYAEGYELMAASPLLDNVTETFKSWQEGTVIRSWLLDLAVLALEQDPGLTKIRGYAADSGEGRWTVEAAIDNAVPMPAITAALFARFASRQEDSPAMKMVAALRNQFGGHAVEAAGVGAATE
jgi:6-phosphogluconate dehydrogenase